MARPEKKTHPSTLPKVDPSSKYSYSPFSIGFEIKKIAVEKRIANDDLSRALSITNRNINRLFKAKIMSMKKLLKVSEVLQENLLLRYHPNVPPVANPLQEENNALKTENEELKEHLKQTRQTAEENIRLKAQLEILERLAMKK